MKVWIQYKKSKSGKGKFVHQRLVPALKELGVEITSHKPDVTLGFSYWREKPKGCPVVRVDGVHLEKKKKYDWRRSCVKKALKNSRGVIWQSEFSKRMMTGIFDVKPKKDFVIYNGANPKDYEVEPIRSPYPKNVIISGRYATGKVRPQKRINIMLRIAQAYTKRHKNTCFWVCGKTRGERGNRQIRYLGDVAEGKLRRYLVMADVMLNIAAMDWCPNSVVESLVAGTPVICSNNSGIAEIVRDCGYILLLDGEVPAKLRHRTYAPPCDERKVYEVIELALAEKRRVRAEHLYISNTARQYLEVFNELCKNP